MFGRLRVLIIAHHLYRKFDKRLGYPFGILRQSRHFALVLPLTCFESYTFAKIRHLVPRERFLYPCCHNCLARVPTPHLRTWLVVIVSAYEVAVAIEPSIRAAVGRFVISNSWDRRSKEPKRRPFSSFEKHLHELSAEAYWYWQDPDFQIGQSGTFSTRWSWWRRRKDATAGATFAQRRQEFVGSGGGDGGAEPEGGSHSDGRSHAARADGKPGRRRQGYRA